MIGLAPSISSVSWDIANGRATAVIDSDNDDDIDDDDDGDTTRRMAIHHQHPAGSDNQRGVRYFSVATHKQNPHGPPCQQSGRVMTKAAHKLRPSHKKPREDRGALSPAAHRVRPARDVSETQALQGVGGLGGPRGQVGLLVWRLAVRSKAPSATEVDIEWPIWATGLAACSVVDHVRCLGALSPRLDELPDPADVGDVRLVQRWGGRGELGSVGLGTAPMGGTRGRSNTIARCGRVTRPASMCVTGQRRDRALAVGGSSRSVNGWLFRED